MKITSGKVNWYETWANSPCFDLVIDELPTGLIYSKNEGIYYAEKDGYVSYLHYLKPGQGYGGRAFSLKMEDGTTETLIGPWSSRAGVVNKLGLGPCIDVYAKELKTGYNLTISLTVEILLNAMSIIDFGKNCEETEFSGGNPLLLKVEDGNDGRYDPGFRLKDGIIWMKNSLGLISWAEVFWEGSTI